jgi:hypothetical protein
MQRRGAGEHELAGAWFNDTGPLIRLGRLAPVIHGLADELRKDTDADSLPSTVAEVIRVAGLTEGARLGELLADLEPDPQVVEAALAKILRLAAVMPPGEDELDSALHRQ